MKRYTPYRATYCTNDRLQDHGGYFVPASVLNNIIQLLRKILDVLFLRSPVQSSVFVTRTYEPRCFRQDRFIWVSPRSVATDIESSYSRSVVRLTPSNEDVAFRITLLP